MSVFQFDFKYFPQIDEVNDTLRLVKEGSLILDYLAFGKPAKYAIHNKQKLKEWNLLKRRLIFEDVSNQLLEFGRVVNIVKEKYLKPYILKLFETAVKDIKESEAKLFFEKKIKPILENKVITDSNELVERFDTTIRFLSAIKGIEKHFKFSTKETLAEVTRFIKEYWFGI